ncbi:MAG: HAMP domain-containing histidine kinase [Bdellovibrionaceae bacterium]|nr:HAMP domain-containing histidine kinase [Bdellovibrio sp.]
MSTRKPDSFLSKERTHTDQSLNNERGRTDESLTLFQTKTEKETEDSVKQGRTLADKLRVSNRTDSDANELKKNNGTLSSRDQNTLTKLLSEQRVIDDKSIAAERTRMDAAMKLEREKYDATAAKLLSRERNETDKNLSHERDETDSLNLKSTNLFNEEVTSHSSTKEQLTSRDEFVAIVSHDLRNPLGAIKSCTDTLLEDASANGLSSDLIQWLQFIKRNAETSLRLISDILDMEQVANGKMLLNKSKINVGALVRQEIEVYNHIAKKNKIHLTAIEPTVNTVIVCDGDRVSQVLSNLIGNAIKFTKEGGLVTLKIEQVEDSLQVAVCDTGPGIPVEQQERIFDRYAQIKNKDRRGLGLGLYISRMLLEAHAGKIWVESTLGKGSTFYFCIPNKC